MKKTLIFLSLLLVTCKAFAADHSYLVGEHSSKLFPIVGAPLEKMHNSLTGKSVWTYKDFKVLIRKDQVIQVQDLNQPKSLVSKAVTKASTTTDSAIKIVPTSTSESTNVDPAMLGEIMKELETKTTSGKSPTPGQNPGIQNGQTNNLQNNMLRYKQ